MSAQDTAGPGAPSKVAPGPRRIQNGNAPKISTSRPAYQWERGLRALLVHGALTTRQLAEPPVYAHAAHSLAAEIRKKGVRLEVEMVEIAAYAGSSTRIAKYAIAAESRELAEQLLAGNR